MFDQAGNLVRSWEMELVEGHGLTLVKEDGLEYLLQSSWTMLLKVLGTCCLESYGQGFQAVEGWDLTPWEIFQPPFGGKGRLKLELWQALEHGADSNLPFQAGQGRPQTEVRAKGKGKVPVLLSGDV